MKVPHRLLGCLLALAWSAAESSAQDEGAPGPYEQSLDRALEKARSETRGTGALLPDHSTWENPWIHRSAHYEVRTTHSRALAKNIADGLETMLGNFKTITGTSYEPVTPFKIFIVPDLAAYNRFGEDFGAEHSSMYGSFFSTEHPERPVVAAYDSNYNRLAMQVTHSAAHQYLDRAIGREVPLWISEGLAAYFALYWDYAGGVSELKRLVTDSSRPFIPLQRLMSDPITEYVTNANNRFVELGMLFVYLLQFRDGTATAFDENGAEIGAPFREYLVAVFSGANVSGHPIHLLLTNQLAEIEADFKAFEFPTE